MQQPLAGGEKVPFLYSLIKVVDEREYDDAVRTSEIGRDSYDPATQTSTFPVYAGTAKTYSDTTTGVVFTGDDSRVSDY